MMLPSRKRRTPAGDHVITRSGRSVLHTGAAFALLALMAVPAWGSFPMVYRCQPLGVVKGEETTLTFYGERLNNAFDALADLPGIEILEVKAVDNKTITVKLKTDPQLANGLYPIRIVTPTGISNLRLIGVGSMPIVQETEPNNDFAKPQVISINSTVEGIVKREDIDHFQVELKEGQRITVEVEALRIAYTLRNRNYLDPFIAILDQGRFEVASSDDSSLLAQDGVCTFKAPADGKYTVIIRDSAFGGSPLSGYRLHIGTFDRPVATIPGGGVPGEKLTATLISIDGTQQKTEIELPKDSQEKFGVFGKSEGNPMSPSPSWIRVSELPVQMETEPNDNHRKSPDYKIPAAFCGVLQADNDFDCFGFECKKNEKFRIQVYARKLLRSPIDAVVNVFGPDGKTIISSDDVGREKDPYIEFSSKVDGKHTVRIYDHLRNGSDLHHYRIEVERANPTFEIQLKEIRRDEASVVAVPVGGHTAVMAQVKRKDYNGQINFSVEGLPEGLTATTFPIPPGRSEIPVLISANQSAKPIAGFFRLLGTGDEKNPKVVGQFHQTHKLVLGQNRRALLEFTTTHSAYAVSTKAPFKIEITQPKSPIVRQGGKNIHIKIIRDEGFDKPVRIRTLYNPPGIGINNGKSIAKDQTEVEIPLSANNGAALGKWPIIFMANYPDPQGTRDIATPAIVLDVQDLHFTYEFPKVAIEQGTDAIVSVTLNIKRPYTGEAEIQLVGLPNGITSSAAIQKITPETTVLNFPITAAKDARVGKHKTLVCQARIKVDGETILQTTGTGELRVDKPLPPKKNAPPPKPKAKKPEPAKPAAPKPLSRLEQLRQMKN